MVIEKSFLHEIINVFGFAERTSFTQIATIAKKENVIVPKLRTVLLFYLEDKGAFRFSCSNKTHKWQEIKNTPKVTGLYLDVKNTKQYRFEADAKLIDKDTQAEKILYEETWIMMRPNLRHVLWQEYLGDKNAKYDISEVCPSHGTIVLFPYYWDIFKLDTTDFSNSKRLQMIKKNGEWQVYQDTPKIHPLDLLDV